MSPSYGIIYTVPLIMTSLVLDTFPTGDFNLPKTVSINTSPFYYGQRKFGQRHFGQRRFGQNNISAKDFSAKFTRRVTF